jgi:hypothetical protein
MSGKSFSSYHEYVATILAREMNEYFGHSEKMMRHFEQRDISGNPPVYTKPDRTETEERRLKIVVFCAIYVEALANLYLSLKLTKEQFSAVDRIEIIEKWTSIPSLFLPGYSIPRGDALFGNLKTLVAQRNAVAHMQPRISAGNEIIHEGNLPKKMHIHGLIERWDRLPDALIENLAVHDHSLAFVKFRALSHVDEYSTLRKRANQALE